MDDSNQDPGHPEPDLVTVFTTSQVDIEPVIKSILDGADIPYVTGGDAMMELFPSDFLGTHGRPRELFFRVPREHAATARALLTEHPDVPDEGTGGDADAET